MLVELIPSAPPPAKKIFLEAHPQSARTCIGHQVILPRNETGEKPRFGRALEIRRPTHQLFLDRRSTKQLGVKALFQL